MPKAKKVPGAKSPNGAFNMQFRNAMGRTLDVLWGESLAARPSGR